MRQRPGRKWAALAIFALAAPAANASDSVGALLEDAGQYFTAPLHWDEGNWLQFGVSLAAIAAAHEYDDHTRTHFVSGLSDPANALDGKDPHSTGDAVPAAAMFVGTWALATLLDDRDGYEEGRTMLEAGALTVLSTELLKVTTGRRRPNETADPDMWGHGGDSFPSLHVGAAFAIGSVLAESGGEDFRWVRRFLGYGLATGTAYSRVKHNAHWLSDTVAGAALGIATAEFTMGRRDARSRPVALSVVPVAGGAMLVFSGRF